MSAGACAFAQVCLDEALDWARQRKTFGQALVEHQVVRHKLMDMRMHLRASEAMLQDVTARFDAHPADAAVQILGGMGYMRGTKSERIYREVKVMMIGGGAEEIMKELAARQLGL
jgi:acyl-CoA dehydrogenase